MNLFVFLRNLRSNSNSDVKNYEKTSRASEDIYIEDRKSVTPDIIEEIQIIQSDEEIEGQVVIASENASKSSNNYINSENPLTASKMFPAKNNLRSPRLAVATPNTSSVSRPCLINPSSSAGRNSSSGRPSFINLTSGQDDVNNNTNNIIVEQQQHEKSKANHYAKLGQNFVQTSAVGGAGSSSMLNSSRRVQAGHGGSPRKLNFSQITKTTTPESPPASQ